MGLIRLRALTDILAENKLRVERIERELRNRAQWSEGQSKPIMPPRVYRGNDFRLAGRAFDFWLRAYLGIQHGVQEGRTVNELVLHNPGWQPYLTEATIKYADGRVVSLKADLTQTVEIRRRLIRQHAIETEEFYENCINNAMAEGLYRSGSFTNLSCDPNVMIEDLRALVKSMLVRADIFAGSEVDLNPVFPHQTIAADGDFAIGRRLIELKTVKDVLPPLVFAQVTSYALIEAWSRGSAASKLRYREVAVYSARHAVFGFVNLAGLDSMLAELRAVLQEATDKQAALQLTPAGRA